MFSTDNDGDHAGANITVTVNMLNDPLVSTSGPRASI